MNNEVLTYLYYIWPFLIMAGAAIAYLGETCFYVYKRKKLGIKYTKTDDLMRRSFL